MVHESYVDFFGKDAKLAESLFNIKEKNIDDNAKRRKLLKKFQHKFLNTSLNEIKDFDILLFIKANNYKIDKLIHWGICAYGTLLAYAIHKGNYELIKELIKEGAYLNVEELKGFYIKRPKLYSISHLLYRIQKIRIGDYFINKHSDMAIIEECIEILIKNGIYLNITECEELFNYDRRYLMMHYSFIKELKSHIMLFQPKVLGEIIFDYLISKDLIKYLKENDIDVIKKLIHHIEN